jgi:pimeloyl-ACP methyl ester carboxylesterase
MSNTRRFVVPLLAAITASLALVSQAQPAVTQGFVERGGARLFYKSEGSGPTMLLIHGYPLSGELFKNNRPTFARDGYRVITVDLRGFGKSTDPGSETGSIATYAQDVLAVMDKLALPKAIIGGMSMGGMIALEMYRRAPERFTALALISTTANPAGQVEQSYWNAIAAKAQAKGSASLVPELMKDMLTGRTTARNPQLVRFLSSLMEGASKRGAVAAAQALANRPDSLPTLPTINVPTLIVIGQEDTLIPVVFSQKMQQNISGSKLVIIPGASHAAVIESSKTVNRALLNWASSLR